jgi:hypothetical protein
MRLRAGVTAFVLGVALATAGCGGSSPELSADRAHTLQESVLGATQAAAEGRWDDAQALLTTTQTELDAGADAGEVSTARYREIAAAIVEVQTQITAEQQRVAAQAAADLAAQQATPTPEPVVTNVAPPAPKGKDKPPGKKGKGGK